MKESKVIVALDFDNRNSLDSFCEQVAPSDCKLKVGKELFTFFGPSLVKDLIQKGFDVFLDLKFHDIPNTVSRAVKAAGDIGVWMTNVHSLGGSKMMEEANKARLACGSKTNLIAVTMLTSHKSSELLEIGINESISCQVEKLAAMTFRSGLDGVVCSARECAGLRGKFGKDFKLVTPGIRLSDDPRNDQSRVATPEVAIKSGSNYLVIGRPITQSEDPASKLREINGLI